MQIYTALQIGDYHTNHCEDYLYVSPLDDDHLLCAVMDGCTTAIDSHLISTLIGKLLRKIIKERAYKELHGILPICGDSEAYLKSILRDLFRELNAAKNQLMLEEREMLSTLILLIANRNTRNGAAIVIGDGAICLNGSITEFERDNKPDYLGFHLHEDFDKWYDSQEQKVVMKSIQDVCIATDGIFMVSKVKDIFSEDSINAIDYLMIDTAKSNNADMLHLKLKELENKFGLKPTDDLGMVRVIF